MQNKNVMHQRRLNNKKLVCGEYFINKKFKITILELFNFM
ncbi:hypothetical protein yrohd0001_33550 [Yersinia rohdei ATCC 43380]|nr:hypothetical protein yrohd0001_33550 [Yersinia rohdei ATCC 43380]